MKIWVAEAERRHILDVMAAKPLDIRIVAMTSEDIPSFKARRGRVFLFWSQGSDGIWPMPEMIVVHGSDLRDFLAWACTYFPDRTPLTSLMRVYHSEILDQVGGFEPPTRMHRLESACVGAVLGEAIGQLEGQGTEQDLSIRACGSTYSFAAARALFLGSPSRSVDGVRDRWERGFLLTMQRQRLVTTATLASIWEIMFQVRDLLSERGPLGLPGESTVAARENSLIARCCVEIMKSGTISDRSWEQLGGESYGLKRAQAAMVHSRELRVISLDEARSVLSASSIPEINRGFLLGYLASLVGPGEMSHYRLLLRSSIDIPGAVVWYGICGGLRTRSSVERFGDGLGWRVLRELVTWEPLVGLPRGDIGLDELQMLLDTRITRIDFRVANPNVIQVEIWPRVYSTFRWGSRVEPKQPELFDRQMTRAAKLDEVSKELQRTIQHLQEIQASLKGGEVAEPRSGRARSRPRRTVDRK